MYLEEMLTGPLKYTRWYRIGNPHATAPQLGMVVRNNVMYVATYCHELGHTFGTRGSRKVRNIPWIIAGWSPKIHKVVSDRSPITRETVPQLGMLVNSNGMCVATYFHECGLTFGTCGSRKVRKYALGICWLVP